MTGSPAPSPARQRPGGPLALVPPVAALALGFACGHLPAPPGHAWAQAVRCLVLGVGPGLLGAWAVRRGAWRSGLAALALGAAAGLFGEAAAYRVAGAARLARTSGGSWGAEFLVIALVSGALAAHDALRALLKGRLHRPGAPGPATADPAPDGGRTGPGEERLLDDYVVERFLGEGGMGRVFLARSLSTGERFAVKTAHLADETTRCAFLSELRVWIDLPDNPHLARCGFLRTVGDRTYVFSEFVDGGSLTDWIVSRRLYEGGTGRALERIVDVAIQSAWGLHAAHEAGVVHQDVKPGNLLMTSDGVAKVADFGLAKAVAAGSGKEQPGPGAAGPANVAGTVTVRGMSPAYCSPEQAMRLPVSRATDVWSFGVSILEMFTGEATWATGTAARFLLEDLLEAGSGDEGIPAVPPSIVKILDRCFVQEPAGRWPTLQEAADALAAVYRDLTGREFPRQEPCAGAVPDGPPDAGRLAVEPPWRPPQEWLARAYQELDRGSRPPRALPPRTGSSRARAVADLAAFEMARELYERLVASGRPQLSVELVDLLLEKGLVHEFLGDAEGAARQYERTVQECESGRVSGDVGTRLARACRRLGDATLSMGRPQVAASLHERVVATLEKVDPTGTAAVEEHALAHRGRGRAGELLGDLPAALTAYDRGVELLQRAASTGAGSEVLDVLALVLGDKARILGLLGRVSEAMMTHDAALKIRSRRASEDGRPASVCGLAVALVEKSATLAAHGRLEESAKLMGKALSSMERLVLTEKHEDRSCELARVYAARARLALVVRDCEAADAFSGRALEIMERLVNEQGRLDLARDLTAARLVRCGVFTAQGEPRRAVPLADEAVRFLRELVREEGRSGLADDLAQALTLAGELAAADSRPAPAVEPLDEALRILQELVERSGQRGLSVALARASSLRASCAAALGDGRLAGALFERAQRILQELVERDGRWEHASELARCLAARADGCVRLGDARAAEALSRAAVQAQEKLVHSTPGHPGRADDLARILLVRAAALQAAADADCALKALDQAVSIWESMVKGKVCAAAHTGLYRAYTDKANLVRSLGRGEEAASLHERATRCRGSGAYRS